MCVSTFNGGATGSSGQLAFSSGLSNLGNSGRITIGVGISTKGRGGSVADRGKWH